MINTLVGGPAYKRLRAQRLRVDELRERIVADPAQQHGLARMRDRIQNRAATRPQDQKR